jgi:hypothetical protein
MPEDSLRLPGFRHVILPTERKLSAAPTSCFTNNIAFAGVQRLGLSLHLPAVRSERFIDVQT